MTTLSRGITGIRGDHSKGHKSNSYRQEQNRVYSQFRYADKGSEGARERNREIRRGGVRGE